MSHVSAIKSHLHSESTTNFSCVNETYQSMSLKSFARSFLNSSEAIGRDSGSFTLRIFGLFCFSSKAHYNERAIPNLRQDSPGTPFSVKSQTQDSIRFPESAESAS
jgi:hypothetical protein